MEQKVPADGPKLWLVPPHGEPAPQGPGDFYKLTLYVADQTPKSVSAIANLRNLCDQYLAGRHSIEVIDLIRNPELAARDQIVAIPTLVRRLPAPIKRIIGTLADTEKTLIGLELQAPAP
jgi:circadian clock protein KaiB